MQIQKATYWVCGSSLDDVYMTTTDANGKGHLITGPSLQRARERFHAQLVEAGKTLDDAYQQMLAAVGAEELSRMHERFKEALGERR